MNLAGIKEKIKKGINTGTDRVLSAKLKDELGLNRPSMATLQNLSQDSDLEANLNSFFTPVNSTFLSSRDYKNIQNWALMFIIGVSVVLFILFFSLILPHKNYSNTQFGSQVIVKGKNINNQDKIATGTADTIPDKANEELSVENIILASAPTQELVKRSPLLSSNSVTLMEYKIRSGDTIEKVASKFYGSSSYNNIQKIKMANHISNARLLQIGQTVIVPM
ncbi:MAG: LysM domain-containing protein [Cyanobacteria bacterium]|nr:LysM domain-containing protein [Cyanobacteriota bacterium]MDA1021115.1 LysM domain-containing protein [Cyanobacteriota bacterium]